MKAPGKRTRPRRAWPRRVGVAWLAATFLAANAVSAAFLVALADRYRVRVDVTATGEHRLAPQTRRLMEAVGPGEGFELVVAAEASRVDPRAWQALLDVGTELQIAGPVTMTLLDGAAARPGLESLAQRLVVREAEAIERQTRALAQAMAELWRAADAIEVDLAEVLESAAKAAGEGELSQVMQARTQAAPRLAQDLRIAVARAREALDTPILPGIDLASLDTARVAIVAPARDAAAQMGLLADEALAITRTTSYPEGLRRVTSRLAQTAGAARAVCSTAADLADRLPMLDVVRVLRSVGDSAVVLVGPSNAVAIDAGTLLPPPGVLRPEAATAPSLRGRAEGFIATAMLTALDSRRPILVVAHAEDTRFIERPGALGVALDHLRRQGIDVVEWPIMLEDSVPGLAQLDAGRARPVLYLVLNTNTGARSPDPMAPRPDERAARLGTLVRRLIDQGNPLLVNLTPSEVVVGGGVDATALPLGEFGLSARSGLAMLTTAPQSEVVEHDMLVRAKVGDHPIQGAVAGLLTYMPWAVPIEHDGSGSAWPLLTVDDTRAWGETRWSGYRRVRREERPLVSNPPVREPDVDDANGPWTIAWAAMRETGGRIVVVGSNDWLADEIVSSGQSLDGRMAASYPGNLALLDASVLWLTGRDEFIAPTVASSSVAMIGSIPPARLSALRWSLVLGVPLLILLVGGVWRLLRR